MKIPLRSISVSLLFLFVFFSSLNGGRTACAIDEELIDSMIVDEIYMMKGDLVTIKVDLLKRLSLTDPEVADIVDATETEVLLIAQEPGQTTLFIWDGQGKRTLTVFVTQDDLKQLEKRVKSLLKSAGISSVETRVNEEEGKIVLVGEVKDEDKDNFETISLDFEDSVIDLTTEDEIKDLIEINMQISEVGATEFRNIGLEWGAGNSTIATYRFDETIPVMNSFGDLFKIGDFQRVHSINVWLNAQEELGKARTLSRPKILVVSGEEASFLVGGEVPVRTITASEGTTTENVEFKDYGISLTLTPTIKNEKIEIELIVEDSDIDPSKPAGEDIAFLTRTAQTMLYLDDKQPIVLAGFIRKARSERIKQVPFLSQVPVFGAFFRNRSTPAQNEDTELIISLTPTIVEKNRKGMVRRANQEAAKKTVPAANLNRRVNNPNYISGIPQEMTGYIQHVQQKISQAVFYPPEAKSFGWEGTVKLGILILNDGTLAYALVKDSSGHEVFDEYALNKARESAPFDPFPSGTDLQELNVTIPIVYSLSK